MYNKIKKLWLFTLAIPKTIYFNFYYFSFKEAIKFPVLVSHRVYLMEMKGKVILRGPLKKGMIKIGFGEVGIFDQHRSRSIWQVSGTVMFIGDALIGHGSKISVSKHGELEFGANFVITAESQIWCKKKIIFGDNVLISWENLIMDTDAHIIKNNKGEIINEESPIIIGDKVWMGCRCTILKGTLIGSGTIIAAGSLITGNYKGEERVILGGRPTRVLKENVFWQS
ncbi:acyltransferase [Bacillus thuringiensis]